jgi:O-antigen ligase
MLPRAVGFGLLVVGAVCFLALVRPPAAFVVVVAALPFYHLATAEVVPGLTLTSLELVGAFLILGLMLPRRQPLAPGIKELPAQFWLLACLLAWAVISAAMSAVPGQEVLTSVKLFSAQLVFWFLTFTFARKRKWFVTLVTAFAIGTVCAEGLGLPQAATGRDIAGAELRRVVERRGKQFVRTEAVRVSGLMTDPNFYAYSSVVALPLCLAGLLSSRRRTVWAVALVILAAALVASYSRGALLAAAATLGWFVLRVRAFRLPALAVVAVAIAVVGAVAPGAYVRRMQEMAAGRFDRSILLRFRFARMAVDIAGSHPVLGIGAGNFIRVNPLKLVVHNTYLETAAELGIPALGMLIAVLALSMRDLWRTRRLLVAWGEKRQVLVITALEAAVVGTATFWLTASMGWNKTAWFVLGAAAASRHALAARNPNDSRTSA